AGARTGIDTSPHDGRALSNFSFLIPIFFSQLPPRPPRPPLFPYTTLFRSSAGMPPDYCRRRIRARHLVRPMRRVSGPPLLHSAIDRKSTRLNSSHLGISYAVFCLKKK